MYNSVISMPCLVTTVSNRPKEPAVGYGGLAHSMGVWSVPIRGVWMSNWAHAAQVWWHHDINQQSPTAVGVHSRAACRIVKGHMRRGPRTAISSELSEW